ncbi:MAG: DUF4159 domain-containing protein [Planctomycetaceae bacterium]
MAYLARRRLVRLVLAIVLCLACGARAQAAEVTWRAAIDAIDRAKHYLLKMQRSDGSWRLDSNGDAFPIGVTCVSLLALLNTGMTAEDREIQRGLRWLRDQKPTMTYEISLMIQALAAAKDGRRDALNVDKLVSLLEQTQIKGGDNDGLWSYGPGRGAIGLSGDRSNAQFAILGLREAQEMGVPVKLDVWRRARNHWIATQNPDGGWSYTGRGAGTTGSMTVAGIASLVITEAMLKAEQKELNPDGTPVCCADDPPDKALEDACRWLGNNFSVRQNPGGNMWLLYYLYGLERAGRFSGRRFFVNNRGDKHDWYREGAEHLVAVQDRLSGAWRGVGQMESDPVLGTGLSLMFMSKGLAPVLINKLQYGSRGEGARGVVASDWNRHKNDVRNLTQHITGLDKWPKLLNWQIVDVSQASVRDLLQAPIVFFNGTDPPRFTQEDLALLKEYVLQGGFLFVVNGCKSAAFDEGFRDMVRQMYPQSEAQLRKLDASHPVFRAEYNLLDRESGEPSAELWGVDVGCRTSIIYSPDDISCLWDKWTSFAIPHRPQALNTMITKAMRVGVNVVAYVTGRELFDKIARDAQVQPDTPIDRVERDLLKLAKIRYTGDWDAAPQALRNLLLALNSTVGLAASTKQRDLTLADPNLFRYPIVYMHGRHDFALGKTEQEKLRQYLDRGGVLVADACCGAPAFDKSFRRLMQQLFPENALKRIPPNHELFNGKVGYELKTVKRREPDVDVSDAALSVAVRTVEPFLEGVEVDGRFIVIYSKYDISCALERQASAACTGYLHDDAVRLGVNIILYALLQ